MRSTPSATGVVRRRLSRAALVSAALIVGAVATTTPTTSTPMAGQQPATVAAPASATAPAAATTRAPTGVVTRARALVQAAVDQQRLPGLSIAVVVRDQLVWSEGFGMADVESGSRATGATVYRIGSVSKPIVATGLMQLLERGRVDLDADVRTYVPELPAKPWPITVRHLLTHTSGIRHYKGDEFLSATRYTDLIGPLAIFKDDPLLFQPGLKVSYTTYGFNLVANVVERASGQPIGEYMRQHVYEPAWMNSTGLEDWPAIQKGRARWYESRNGQWINAPYADLSNKYAGGGLTSTVEDLARLHIAYARGALMKPETMRLMYTNQRLNDGSAHDFGLAWRVRQVKTPSGRAVREVSHSGGSVGANSLLIRYPDEGFAIAAIANHPAKLEALLGPVIALFEVAGAIAPQPAATATGANTAR